MLETKQNQHVVNFDESREELVYNTGRTLGGFERVLDARSGVEAARNDIEVSLQNKQTGTCTVNNKPRSPRWLAVAIVEVVSGY